jgi:hypothetical protein
VLNSSAARLTGKHGDSASVAHPQSGGDALFELKLDALGAMTVDQPFPVLSHIAGHTRSDSSGRSLPSVWLTSKT